MTPLDIEMKEFTKGLMGYNTKEVKAFQESVAKIFGDLQQDNLELKQEVQRLNDKLEHYRTIEQTLQDTMILAEQTSRQRAKEAKEEADKIILEGTFKSDQMIEKARHEVYAIKQNIDGLQKQYKDTKNQMKQMLQNQLDILENEGNSIEEINTIESYNSSDSAAVLEDLNDQEETFEDSYSDDKATTSDSFSSNYYSNEDYYNSDYNNEDYYTKEYQIINEEDVI